MACKTPIKGLYLSGSDVFALGIGGALTGGVAAVCVISGLLGLRAIPKIQTAARKYRAANQL